MDNENSLKMMAMKINHLQFELKSKQEEVEELKNAYQLNKKTLALITSEK